MESCRRVHDSVCEGKSMHLKGTTTLVQSKILEIDYVDSVAAYFYLALQTCIITIQRAEMAGRPEGS